MDKKEELVYLAGFTDGEGYLGVAQGEPQLQISNTNHSIIYHFKKKYKIGTIRKAKRRSLKHKQQLTWQVNGEELKYLLPELIPYLKIKREQSKLVLEYCKTICKWNRSFLPVYIINKREKIYQKLKQLNVRGCPQKINSRDDKKNKSNQLIFKEV